MAFGVREVADHEICLRVLFGTHSTRPAEALGLLERRLDVRNADVKDDVALLQPTPPPTPPGIPVPSLVVLRSTNP